MASNSIKQSIYQLRILGTGAGASYVYDGLTSSSFMLLQDGEPFCLIDLGLGVGRKVVEDYQAFPNTIVITHNHSDHAGDLPVVLRVELARANKCHVIAAKPVAERLQQHRVAEHNEQLAPIELADWSAVESGEIENIGHGLTIEFFPGIHSELSFGFVISDQHGRKRLSYTGDSRFETNLYQSLAQADVFIMDARPQANPWHADFSQVEAWVTEQTYIIGHGLAEKEAKQLYPKLPLLLPNQLLDF